MNADQLADLLQDAGSRRVRANAREVIGTCPIHLENNPSFGASVDKEGHPWCCFACGKSGLLPKIFVETTGCGWAEAVARVRRYGEYTYTGWGQVQTGVREIDYPDARTMHQYASAWKPPNAAAKLYLRSRGVSRDAAVNANVRVHEDRLVFPWYGDNLMIRGFTTRSYVQARDPYRGLPLFGFRKHDCVYRAWGMSGVDLKRLRLHVCEGEISALRLQSLGYPAVALSGWKMSGKQAEEIERLSRTVVLLLDRDAEGVAGLTEASNLLHSRVVLLRPQRLPDEYADPAECPEKPLRQCLTDDALTLSYSLTGARRV